VLFYTVDNVIKLTPVQVESMLLGVPSNLLVDTQAFVVDGVPAPFLPIGAARNTYLKCHLWYPHSEVAYIEDHVYVLAHKSGANSTSFMTLSCHISFLFPSADTDWDMIYSVRPIE
jgi:hypothetical protein